MLFGEKKLGLKVEVEVLRKENETLKSQISDLQTQRQQLMDQNRQLQEALVSKTAPQAYVDQKMTKYDELPLGARDKMAPDTVNQILTEYIREIEKPALFDSVEDMMVKLTQPTGGPSKPSIHNNDES